MLGLSSIVGRVSLELVQVVSRAFPAPRGRGELGLTPTLLQLRAAGRSGRRGRSVTLAVEAASARGTEAARLLPLRTAAGTVRG